LRHLLSVKEDTPRAAKAAELEQRLVNFAVSITCLSNRLDHTLAGRHVAGQIVRSGTAAAPNYSEARSAESRADFIHKLRIAIKELNETAVWLQIIVASDLDAPDVVRPLADECAVLQRILGASLRTARANAAAGTPVPDPNRPVGQATGNKRQATGDRQQATGNNQ